jgi:hypothetical protein
MSPAFGPADLTLLSALAQHNAAARAVLCTLARRGAAMRRDQPERASAWIDALGVHPYYKGGQFLFDLLEWEDFMLDGEPPPVLDEVALAALLNQYARMLRALAEALGQAVVAVAPPAEVAESAPDLPPLSGSAYLFPDVVLGLVWVAAR